jgi:hypothetical protein
VSIDTPVLVTRVWVMCIKHQAAVDQLLTNSTRQHSSHLQVPYLCCPLLLPGLHCAAVVQYDFQQHALVALQELCIAPAVGCMLALQGLKLRLDQQTTVVA